jgi:acetolactate synthase-1/2/3 large subunit
MYHGLRDVGRNGRRTAVVNIWVDPREYAPGTKNQTMYK